MTTAPADVTAAITDGATQGKDVIADNMPVVFSVAIAFVAWS